MKRYLIVMLLLSVLCCAQTKIDLATRVKSSVFIDSTTAALLPLTTFPSIPAGNYVIEIGITDNAGKWSNLVSYAFTADGAHAYAVEWNPPASWWSLGATTTYLGFTTSSTVTAWASFNSGAFVQIVNSGDLSTIVGYNWFNPYVRLSGTYTTGSLAVPSALNTLPALNLSQGGPVSQITGAVLKAPQIGWINIDPYPGLGDWLSINGFGKIGVEFDDPENTTGYCEGGETNGTFTRAKALLGGGLYFETNGVPQGSIYFCAGTTRLGAGGSGKDGNLLLSTVQELPQLFSFLGACSSGSEGKDGTITDSTTNTWGATITGGGSLHVKAYCDGTNWTVIGK